MLRSMRLAVLALAMLPCVARTEDPPPIRVFYTGHSFHMFMPGPDGQDMDAFTITYERKK